MIGVKIFELFIMSVVFIGLWQWNKNLLLAGVFLMGTHSAIFGPCKYGSLPELLSERKMAWGNGRPIWHRTRLSSSASPPPR